MKIFVKYRERVFIGRHECIDYCYQLTAKECWKVGGIWYFRLNAFDVRAIAADDIIEMVEF